MYNKLRSSTNRAKLTGGNKKILSDVFAVASGEQKFYFLGWLMANTTIIHLENKDTGKHTYVANVYTHEENADALRECMNFLGLGDTAMQITKKHVATLRSVSLAPLVLKYGIVKDRDARHVPYEITPDMLPHFWRGFVQANSVVGVDETKHLYLDIQAPRTLMEQLVSYINDNQLTIAAMNKYEITLRDKDAADFYNILIVNGDVHVASEAYHQQFEASYALYHDILVTAE